MKRRDLLTTAGLAGLGALLTPREEKAQAAPVTAREAQAQQAAAAATRGMPMPRSRTSKSSRRSPAARC